MSDDEPKGRKGRRSQLASLFQPDVTARDGQGDGQADAPGNEKAAERTADIDKPAAARPATPLRSPSGAVRAMGLSLGGTGDAKLREERDAALAEAAALREGERVVELDPVAVAPSPLRDRLALADAHDDTFAALKASIAADGQQVPVLVRPHPDPASGFKYQTAFGHRRIEATRQLGLAVLAVVRPLDDAALALAQGKENADRRDLSFIERAMFARTLIEAGHDRAVAMATLSVQKSEMARLLQVAERIPPHLARAIGPAPRIGRPRWLKFTELLDGQGATEKATRAIHSEAFKAAGSDERFALAFDALARARKTSKPQATVVRHEGRPLARIAQTGGEVTVKLDKQHEALAAELARRVADLLPELLSERGKQDEPNPSKGGRTAKR